MSYIYSPVLVAASLGASYLDTDASAPLNGNPTPKPCLWHDSKMDVSRLSRFGMTCKPLTADHGAALLTSWLAASRAKTSAWPGVGQALTESAAACGTTWPASLAKYDPASHSLKTAQLSLIEDLTGCSLTLPRSGLMRDGECYPLPMLVPTTSASESGYWLTPTASDACDRTPSTNIHLTKSGLPKHVAQNGQKSQMRLSQMVKMWPTPTCQDAEQAGGKGCIERGKRGLSLHQATQMFPTVRASDYKSGKFSVQGKEKRDSHTRGKALNETIGGQLNPPWVEWLMGWPIGQTELKPLETAKYQEWQQQHSLN